MRLTSLRLENIGGFTTATFDLDGNRLLVGENNSGKTSLLLVLNWLMNSADTALLRGGRPLTSAETRLLVPARATRNKARRLVATVAIDDGRTRRRFGQAPELRIQFRRGNTFAKLSAPVKGEAQESESDALMLLKRLQESYTAVYVPAVRDATTDAFRLSLASVLKHHLTSSFEHGPGPTPSRIKKLRQAGGVIADHARTQADKAWSDVSSRIDPSLMPDVTFRAGLSEEVLIEHMLGLLAPSFSTGAHDAERVEAGQLGAGLQSVLAMALTQMALIDRPNKLLMLEEPEAFLHPTVQRSIAQRVLARDGLQTIATTHSPVVLAEAAAETVVVLSKHAIYAPLEVDEQQATIDQSQLTNTIAPVMFDRSILLVEGEGDVAYFESLRRQLAESDIVPWEVTNRMRVAAVGGKGSFGPWFRLLRRYRTPAGALLFQVIACGDSIDAGTDLCEAIKRTDLTIPHDLRTQIGQMASTPAGSAPASPDREAAEAVEARTTAVNAQIEAAGLPLHFTPVDLEFMATRHLSDERAVEFAALIGIEAVSTAADLASRMGSKGGATGASSAKGAKAPWVRTRLAQFVEWSEVHPDTRTLLWRWVQGALDESRPTRPVLLK